MFNTINMPKKLTAENGAKCLMSGEFYTEQELTCIECHDNMPDDKCAVCKGQFQYIQKTPIDWITIKKIYAMAVKHLGT